MWTGTLGSEAEEVPADVWVRGFECLGACDIAPMASIDERYYGPLEPGDAETAVEQMRKRGDEVLPEKRIEDRGAAGGKRSRGRPDQRAPRQQAEAAAAEEVS